jgi:transposase
MEQPTALINRIRGLLSELGLVLPQKTATVRREAHKHLEDLPCWCSTVVGDALSELTHLDTRIKPYDQYIKQSAKEVTQARQLMQLSGVGPTTASATIATVGKGRDSSVPGWGWYRGNTARVANSDWDTSPRPVTRTCAQC